MHLFAVDKAFFIKDAEDRELMRLEADREGGLVCWYVVTDTGFEGCTEEECDGLEEEFQRYAWEVVKEESA